MDSKYIQDAELLIKQALSKQNKIIQPLTKITNYKKDILPNFTFNQDGWRNLVSGLGGQQAKSSYTTYRTSFIFNDNLIHSLYESHGMSYIVASLYSEDATKNDIKIKDDIDGILLDKWDQLGAIAEFELADIYRRFYGGSLIYIDIDDGKDLTEPVNENNIKEVRRLRTYCRTDVFFTNIHFTEDIRSPNYGQPEYYTIIPKYSTPFNIHYSRVIEFKGRQMPAQLDNGYRYYWGQSELEPLWEDMKKVGAAIENIDQLLYEMTIAIYKIKGLADLIHGKKWDTIKNIIDQTELAKSTIRALLIDAEGHDYKRDSLQFSGVKDVVELLFALVTSSAKIPMVRFFGKQMGGLNNDAQGELSGYYDRVKTWQKNKLKKQAQKLVNYISLSKEIKKKISNPIVEFESPYQLTQKEELENKKIQADIDKIYIDMGAINTEEIRELRFENDYSYSCNVSELESYRENLVEEQEMQEQQQREAQLQLAQMQQQGNQEEESKQPNIIQKNKK